MEIPPPSSISQISALFNDYTEASRNKAVLGIAPFESPNTQLYSSNVERATSHTGLDVEFRTKDIHEGHRLLNGPLLYPFQAKAQIFNHKFDPFYYDGSELDENYNVQENLIGTPLGASTLEDPRLTYVKNMLQLKEMHGANHPLDDSYIQELYMVNAEKGSNYYQAQLNKLDASMSNYTRTNRYANHKPLQDIQFTYNIATGNPVHEKHTARKTFQSPSEAGIVQNSRRKKRMERIDAMTAPYSVVPVNKLQSSNQRGQERVQTIEGGTQTVTESNTNRAAIALTDSTVQTENEDMVDPIDERTHDRQLTMSSLGSPNANVIPHTQSANLDVSREMSVTSSASVREPSFSDDDDDSPFLTMGDVDEFIAKIRQRRARVADYESRRGINPGKFASLLEPDVDPSSKLAQKLLGPRRTPESSPLISPMPTAPSTPRLSHTPSSKWKRRRDEDEEKSTERYGHTG
jgi:hypothetical protein